MAALSNESTTVITAIFDWVGIVGSSLPPSVEAVPSVPDVVPPASDVPSVIPVEPPVEPYIAPVDYPGSITNPANLIYDFNSAFKSLRIYSILIFFELGLLILFQFLKL